MRRTVIVLATVLLLVPAAAANEPPVAAFSFPASVTVGDVVTFNGSGSYDPDGEIVAYRWSFNETGPVEEVRFTEPGAFNVTLNVLDDGGNVSYTTKTVTVTPSRAPRVDITANATTVQVGEPVRLTADATDPDGTVTAYSWSTGGTGPATTARFDVPGTVRVTVTVSDGTDTAATASTLLQVEPRPVDDTTAAPTGFAARVSPAASTAASILLGTVLAAIIALVYVRSRGPEEDLAPEEGELDVETEDEPWDIP